jgi:hypothetical protein
VREFRTLGSVPGALGNRRPYGGGSSFIGASAHDVWKLYQILKGLVIFALLSRVLNVK